MSVGSTQENEGFANVVAEETVDAKTGSGGMFGLFGRRGGGEPGGDDGDE